MAKSSVACIRTYQFVAAPGFCAWWWLGWLVDGAQEIIEGIRGLRTRQDADEFAVGLGAAGATQDVYDEDAAQQLLPVGFDMKNYSQPGSNHLI